MEAKSLATLMQTGQGTQETESPPRGTCSYKLVALCWKSSKQKCVALSTAEAEYVALSAAVQEAIWLQQLTSDLLNKNIGEMTVHEDNQSTSPLPRIRAYWHKILLH